MDVIPFMPKLMEELRWNALSPLLVSMDEIMPGLYLGNIFAYRSAQAIKELGISHILSVLNGITGPPNGMEDIIHMNVPVEDVPGEDLLFYFKKTNGFIDEAMERYEEAARVNAENPSVPPMRGGILVHCAMGASRSATVVAAYLMWKQKISAEDAIHKLVSKRPVVHPNAGFMEQLKVFETLGCDVVTNPEPYHVWVASNTR